MTRCRALVAGFGRPGMRDLDFGRQLVRYFESLDWPDGVTVEDLSCSAPLVLDRLRELDPAKVVLIGATARDFDPPGTLRRYRVDPTPPRPDEVQRSLAESVQGVVDLDHTLSVARHWGRLPPETVVIEVEPADCSFGLGFSEELGAAFDPILAMVRDEVGETIVHPDVDTADTKGSGNHGSSETIATEDCAVGPSEGLLELLRYRRAHERTRRIHSYRGGPLLGPSLPPREGLEVVARSRPWSVNVETGAHWSDVVAVEDGWVAAVVGDVGGRGVEAIAAMADLRAAVRAYAVVDGVSPARVITHLDRLVHITGVGAGATLVYVALNPSTGELRLGNAGHPPPLVVVGGDSWFMRTALSEPLGVRACPRPEATLRLSPGSALLLFTAGLVRSQTGSAAEGLARMQGVARHAGASLDALCDRVLNVGARSLDHNDDISLLALRLGNGRGFGSDGFEQDWALATDDGGRQDSSPA